MNKYYKSKKSGLVMLKSEWLKEFGLPETMWKQVVAVNNLKQVYLVLDETDLCDQEYSSYEISYEMRGM